MAFTANSVTTEWKLTGSELGLLLSASLIGIGAGSLFIAPWADRIGRRPLILSAAAVAGIGMVLSAFVQSPVQLGLLRVLTGLGIGAIITTNIVMAGEYASRRFHGMAISLTSIGYPVGAVVGGILSIDLIENFGWRSVFLVGGLLTLAVSGLAYFRLPESLDYLLVRQPAGALERANRMARRLGQRELAELPPRSTAPDGVVNGFRSLFAPGLRRSTSLLWGAFFLILAGFYFVTSWTPKLLVTAGLSPAMAISGGVLLSVGGVFGTLILGVLLTRFRMRAVVFGYIITAAVMMAVFLSTTSSLVTALCIAALIGLLLNGCVTGLYAMVSAIYEPGIRSTAMGSSVGSAGSARSWHRSSRGHFWTPAGLPTSSTSPAPCSSPSPECCSCWCEGRIPNRRRRRRSRPLRQSCSRWQVIAHAATPLRPPDAMKERRPRPFIASEISAVGFCARWVANSRVAPAASLRTSTGTRPPTSGRRAPLLK